MRSHAGTPSRKRRSTTCPAQSNAASATETILHGRRRAVLVVLPEPGTVVSQRADSRVYAVVGSRALSVAHGRRRWCMPAPPHRSRGGDLVHRRTWAPSSRAARSRLCQSATSRPALVRVLLQHHARVAAVQSATGSDACRHLAGAHHAECRTLWSWVATWPWRARSGSRCSAVRAGLRGSRHAAYARLIIFLWFAVPGRRVSKRPTTLHSTGGSTTSRPVKTVRLAAPHLLRPHTSPRELRGR
jgi:hypothetical protein